MSCIAVMIVAQIVRRIPPIQNIIGSCIDSRFERLATMITRTGPILDHVLTFRRNHLDTSFEGIFFTARVLMAINVVLIHGL